MHGIQKYGSLLGVRDLPPQVSCHRRFPIQRLPGLLHLRHGLIDLVHLLAQVLDLDVESGKSFEYVLLWGVGIVLDPRPDRRGYSIAATLVHQRVNAPGDDLHHQGAIQ